jgi:hypothetical protein
MPPLDFFFDKLQMRILTNIIISSLIFCAFGCNSKICAQEKTYPVLGSEDYNAILDKLFPRDVLDKPGRNFILVLRYKPSFGAESQIVISGRDDDVNVVEFTASENVYYKLADVMEKTGEENSVELARYIPVKKRELKIPLRQLNVWRRNLIDSVSRALRPKVLESTLPRAKTLTQTDDGTDYELWDSSFAGEVYFNPSGSEEGGRDFSGKRAFIKWLERIKQDISKRK